MTDRHRIDARDAALLIALAAAFLAGFAVATWVQP